MIDFGTKLQIGIPFAGVLFYFTVMNKISTFVFAIFLLSCASKKDNLEVKKEAEKSIEAKKDDSNKINKLKAAGYTFGKIVDKTGLDGCSFVIQTQDSSFLEPIGLEDQYKKNQLSIAFKYRPSRAMSTCMMGKPAVISEVKLIK